MCGLNGIFAYVSAAPAPADAELLATREAMRARGPDGVGAWTDPTGRCALAHRRLAILDLSDRALQPMTAPDLRLTVIFNGQIYNYPELRDELAAAGASFVTTCDTEILLHLYARHGRDMVGKLRGMFAFAIFDEARHGLFLARDPYGIKPLYVADDGRTVRFASQVKALLAGGAVSREPDPAGIVGFHLFGSVPEPFTIHRDITALPAGNTQWFDARGAEPPRPFVNLSEILAEGAADPAPAADIVRLVRAAALDSVRAHLLADVEVGLFLSAGVDSGALLGLMRDAGQSRIRAITLAFDEFRGSAEDESPLAARVAARYGATQIVRQVSEAEFRENLPAILAAMDQPSIDGINTWFVAKAAKDAGLKVALSGLGGDELLAGYASFTDLPRWRRRYGALAAIPGAGALARALIKTFLPGLAASRPKTLGMLDYAGSWAGAYLLRRGLFLPDELTALLGPDVARQGLERLAPLVRLQATLQPDPGSDNGRVAALESAHYMRNQLLRDADWAGMAHGIEIRTPLVDIGILKRLASVIPCLTPGAGKAALGAAPSLPLPEDVMRRAKTGFGVPTGAWTDAAAERAQIDRGEPPRKGLASRKWSRVVIQGAIEAELTR
jgi:asparagine synthase (glutamine-hydrolysing)